MYVKLYEDIARHGEIASSYDYPVLVAGCYVMSPSPIPKFDNPKMRGCPALQLFGAGREKRVYAVPPYTEVKSPCDGVVGTLPYRVGALVSASLPQPLTTVSDNSDMYVYFSRQRTNCLL